MFNLETLDKVIAVVVVLLALSLFVQSLQGLLKKAFKIKSLQIEQSLVHLFHYVLNKNALESLTSVADKSPFMRTIMPGTRHPSERDPDVAALFSAVAREFKKVGRTTQSGKLMLGSISKGDLLKFLGRVPVADLIDKISPGDKLAEIEAQIASLRTVIQQLKTEYREFVGETDFARIEEALTPLLSDLSRFLHGRGDANVILEDISRLKEVDPDQVFRLLAEMPVRIDRIIAQVQGGRAPASLKEATVKALQQMKAAVAAFSGGVEELVRGFARIRALRSKVETWYDTVMQSFEERYTRSMKTWTVIISIIVVILLNANIINIYREISSSDAKRTLILQSVERFQSRGTAAQAPGGAAPDTAPQTPEALYKEGLKVINDNIGDYTSMGFQGPGWMREVSDWFSGAGNYRSAPFNTWRFGLGQAAKTL
ncbi:MAG TPA: hypothetical protein VF723_14510, partial [Pyrinomonadaceae bacterium]